MLGFRTVLGILLAGLALILVVLIHLRPAGGPPGDGPRAASEAAPAGGRRPLFTESPVELFVTRDSGEIERLFRPPQPQPDGPVALCRYSLRGGGALDFEAVRLRVPAWDVDDVLAERGVAKGASTRFWYSDNSRRPGDEPADFEVVGCRGSEEALLFAGRIRTR